MCPFGIHGSRACFINSARLGWRAWRGVRGFDDRFQVWFAFDACLIDHTQFSGSGRPGSRGSTVAGRNYRLARVSPSPERHAAIVYQLCVVRVRS
jgi:hypothetical protein